MIGYLVGLIRVVMRSPMKNRRVKMKPNAKTELMRTPSIILVGTFFGTSYISLLKWSTPSKPKFQSGLFRQFELLKVLTGEE